MRTSRRRFLAGSSALALSTCPGLPLPRALAAKLGKRHLLLVGTETSGKSTAKGIYLYAFDSITSDLEQLSLGAETPAPTFLALSPKNKFLYAVNESGFPGLDGKPGRGGMVTGYTFNAARQTLTEINQVSSAGSGPVYVSVDHTGKCAFAANYGSGSIASFKIDPKTGALSQAVSTFEYKPPTYAPSKRSHAHRVTVSPDNRYLLVNDLGLDQIHIYRLDPDTAELIPFTDWSAGDGDGPRGLRFHPNHNIVYCVNETQPTIHVLDFSSGFLTKLQTLRLLPEGESPDKCHPGDIVFDKQARHAYVSTRRDNTVAIFNIDADGKLAQQGKIDSAGIRPRDLTMDPTDNWVLVANQDSNNIAVLKRDPITGALSDPKKSAKLDQPMCLIFPERSSIV